MTYLSREGGSRSQSGVALFEFAISLVFLLIPLQLGISLSTALGQRATIVESMRAAGRLAGHATPTSGDPSLELCTMARSSLMNLLNRASIPANVEIESIDLNSSHSMASMRRIEAMRITVTTGGAGLGWRFIKAIGYSPTVTDEFLLESGIAVQPSDASSNHDC